MTSLPKPEEEVLIQTGIWAGTDLTGKLYLKTSGKDTVFIMRSFFEDSIPNCTYRVRLDSNKITRNGPYFCLTVEGDTISKGIYKNDSFSGRRYIYNENNKISVVKNHLPEGLLSTCEYDSIGRLAYFGLAHKKKIFYAAKYDQHNQLIGEVGNPFQNFLYYNDNPDNLFVKGSLYLAQEPYRKRKLIEIINSKLELYDPLANGTFSMIDSMRYDYTISTSLKGKFPIYFLMETIDLTDGIRVIDTIKVNLPKL